MTKKWLLALLSCVVLVFAFDWRMRPSPEALSVEAYDPFIQPSVIQKQQYIETELARGMISLSPTAPGHCLIVPKRAVLRFEDLTSEEVVEMSYIIRRTQEAIEAKMGPCDYVLLQKNGACVGQASNHLIWHYVPRSCAQRSVLLFTLRFAHPFHSKLSDTVMREWVDSMKEIIAKKTESEIAFVRPEGSSELSAIESYQADVSEVTLDGFTSSHIELEEIVD
jgi:diadenosine tetraphosphate (Ap4A) HIT family hydrolase